MYLNIQNKNNYKAFDQKYNVNANGQTTKNKLSLNSFETAKPLGLSHARSISSNLSHTLNTGLNTREFRLTTITRQQVNPPINWQSYKKPPQEDNIPKCVIELIQNKSENTTARLKELFDHFKKTDYLIVLPRVLRVAVIKLYLYQGLLDEAEQIVKALIYKINSMQANLNIPFLAGLTLGELNDYLDVIQHMREPIISLK